MRKPHPTALAVTLALASGAAFAQTPGAASETPGPSAGEPSASPEPTSPRPAADRAPSKKPHGIRTILVVDDPDGGAMTRQLTLSAAMLYASMASAADEVGLYAASAETARVPPVAVRGGEVFARLREVLGSLPDARPASFTEATDFALKALGPPRPGVVDAVVILAHSPKVGPPTPRITPDLAERLAERKIVVFVVAFGTRAEPAAYAALVTPTGGEGFKVARGVDLKRAFGDIHTRLHESDALPVVGDRIVLDESISEATVVVPKKSRKEKNELVTPGDRVLSAKTKYPGVDWTSFAEYDLVRIEKPEAGTWRVRQPSELGGIVGLVNASELWLEVAISPRRPMAGTPVTIVAHLERGGRLVDSYAQLKHLVIEAEITDPAGRMRPLRLERGDHGHFRGELVPEGEGYHEVRLSAFSPDVQRERRATFLVHPTCFVGQFEKGDRLVTVDLRPSCPRFSELYAELVVERDGLAVATLGFDRVGRQLRVLAPPPDLGKSHTLRVKIRAVTEDGLSLESDGGGPFTDRARDPTLLDYIGAVLKRLALLNVPVVVGVLGLAAVRQARRGARHRYGELDEGEDA